MTNKECILATIRNHKPVLAKLGITGIGLFGSYVRSEQSANSNIDILIVCDSNIENYDNYMAVYDFFQQLFINEKVEIITKNGLSPYVGPRILEEVLYV
jgi:predicted nucleotidyltransferase